MPWSARPPHTTRSSQTSETNLETLRLRLLASEVAASSESEDRKAIAALLAGNTASARRRLQDLTASDNATAALWSDLAAALYADAKNNMSVFCSALAAADRAIDIDTKLPEARFNRAVILEALSLRDAAAKAYGDYLKIDSLSVWAAEARERLNHLNAPRTRRELWGDVQTAIDKAVAEEDEQFIAKAAGDFPQEARTWGETEYLGEWGQRTLADDKDGAASLLKRSRMMGVALERITGEALLAESVASIDRAQTDRVRWNSLATGHAAYRKGRKLLAQRHVDGALAELRKAQQHLQRGGSPMALLAARYIGSASIDAGKPAAAMSIANELVVKTPRRYHALRALTESLRGACAGLDGLIDQNLLAYQHANDEFLRLGEQRNATEMQARIAALLTMLGREADAWALRRTSFAAASEAGDARNLELTLYSAVFDSLRDGRWDVAHSLLALVTEIETGNPRMHAEALVWRGVAAKRAGLKRTAASALEEARRAPSLISDPGLREDVTNELRLVEALLVRDQEPHRSIDLLTEYLASARRRGRMTLLPQVLAERARDFRAVKNLGRAEADLQDAIDLIESRRQAITRDDLRDSFLGKSSAAYVALSDILDQRDETARAIAVADRRRARIILDRIPRASEESLAFSLDRVVKTLEPHKVILTYGIFEDRLVIYAITDRGVNRFSLEVPASRFKHLSEDFASAIQRGGLNEARAAARELSSCLIIPALSALTNVHSLVIVNDPELEDIPFSALLQENGQWLVETFTISVVPSIETYAATAARHPQQIGDLLAVGNPHLDADRFSSLPSLPGAEAEVEQIWPLYDSGTKLLGNDASKERIVPLLQRHEVAHLATHAVTDPEAPQRSRLLLAGRDGVSLSTGEIAMMNLSNLRVVVLAGCRTAVAAEGYGDLRSLAAGFLAAGAQNVVASLWDIDDDVARELSVAFHRGLREGRSPAAALRDAQLQMLRSNDPRFRQLRAWAALQLYGAGT